MDSIPITDHPHPNSSSHYPASKLPIKRKTHLSLDSISRRDGPYKFHRIWTEHDEILFLQSLVNSPPLCFPRDLHVFFNRFLGSVCRRPYTKSQLSEKLRRLRKKWRVVSTRLSMGLDLNRLSEHDKMLFELSEQLWHPRFAGTSPFGATNAITSKVNDVNGSVYDQCEVGDCDKNVNCCDFDAKVSETGKLDDGSNEIGRIVAKTVVDVFDESVKYVKSGKRFGGEGKCESFEKRWRELRVVEMEVLAQRMRLVVEDSIIKR